MIVLGNQGSPVPTAIAGEHHYDAEPPAGPGHIWIEDSDGATRCACCQMLRTWPGAAFECSRRPKRNAKLAIDRRAQMAAAIDAGDSVEAVAAAFGCTRRSVYRAVADARTGRSRGVGGCPPSTEAADDDEILRRYRLGETKVSLAKAFGVSEHVIRRVVRGVRISPAMRNRRRARLITARGQSLTIKQWAARTGLSEAAIRDRLSRGWPEEDAVTVRRHVRLPRKERRDAVG